MSEVYDNEGNALSQDALPDVGAVGALVRAEIDTQIATAHRFPRSLAKFKARATEMATFDEDTAASCIYSRPVGKKKNDVTGKWEESFAEGMSIRMAEIVGACFGNLRVGADIIEMTDRYVKARGYAHDLETNFANTAVVVESTVDKNGKPYNERMRIVVAKAAQSKARRDATFAVVPRALAKPIMEAARKVAVGDATTLAKRRSAVMEWISKLGINVNRVFAALEIADQEGIGLEQLTTLTGIKTAIKDGDVTVDEAFPPLKEDGGTTDVARPNYDDAKFAEQLPKWKTMIVSGKKTADGIIATVESVAPMTEAQKKQLREIQPATNAEGAKA